MGDKIMEGLPSGFIIKKNENLSYKIIRPLGQGGFAITYKAEKMDSQEIPEEVVIKEYFPYKALSARREIDNKSNPWNVKCDHSEFNYWLGKFNEEPERIVQCPSLKDHPNIVTMKDHKIRCNNTYYYVMSFIKGKTVSEYVDQSGTFTEEEALKVIRKMGSPVKAFHDNNLIHWDISYTNVMFELDDLYKVERVRLIDFGLTKVYSDEGNIISRATNVGTPGFIDDQLRGTSRFYPQADLYSIASVLYFMLYGNAAKLIDTPLDFDDTISLDTKVLIKRARGEMGFDQRPKDIKEFNGWIDASLTKIYSRKSGVYTKPEPKIVQKEPVRIEKSEQSDDTGIQKYWPLLRTVFLYLLGGILALGSIFYIKEQLSGSSDIEIEKPAVVDKSNPIPVAPVTPVDKPQLDAAEVNRWFNKVNTGEITESDLLSKCTNDAYFAIDRNGVLFEDPENMNYRIKNLFSETNYNYHIGKNYTVSDVYLNKDSLVEAIIIVESNKK